MLQLKHQGIDGQTSGNKAILGLDPQSEFDQIEHATILRQISKLNLGECSYNYVRDFLTDRGAELVAGDLRVGERTMGHKGTPQGTVISPMLVNLVMIGVVERLEKLEDVENTIYADDIMLWV